MARFIALGGVSLKMDYNESVGLVDDNGAGKSTFIKILAGYLRALVSQLPVYRNIFLGFEKRRGILLDKKTMKNESKRMLKEFGIDIGT